MSAATDASGPNRYAAFTLSPDGGNRAGVWTGEELPSAARMQRIATELGYSETVFIAPLHGARRRVRYFSPAAEVSFCGHATIAAGVHLGSVDGAGDYTLDTAVGAVPVSTRRDGAHWRASLTSVEPRHEAVPPGLLRAALRTLGWSEGELDPSIPPARAYAGAWHLVLAAADRSRLDTLAYDFAALKALMLAAGLTTLQLVWRAPDGSFLSRNPFPVGGVVEDPATGAAAAALGGYLRDAGLLATPSRFEIRQGEAMGRPSRLQVDVPASGGVRVSGTAVAIEAGVPA